MQKAVSFYFLFLALLVLNETTAQSRPDSAVTISINAVAGLQFDVVRFAVKPGAKVTLLLSNQDDMSHNLLITRPGTRQAVVNAAMNLGDRGPEQNFIPELGDVLHAIKLLAPSETQTITFTAPDKPGVFPYVCTYPGHGFVMYGAMYVTNDPLPPIEKDLAIPEMRRTSHSKNTVTQADHAGHGKDTAPKRAHPFETVPPFLYRAFMDDASPAAIAVNLPHQLSYCWDAGSCRLLYAWQGEFLDNTEFWKGHKDANAKVMGDIFYRDKADFPLHIGNSNQVPVAKFKGYKLINRFPEFQYSLDGVTVYELIQPKKDGSGLIRTFRIPKASTPVWFEFDALDGVTYNTNKGKPEKNRIRLSPSEAVQFSITMTKKDGIKL
jgi:azurin